MRLAESGIQELQQYVDTLIIIPNQNLFRIANEKTTFADAFKMADDVLHAGVSGVTDLMVKPGLINLDFADIRSVMTEMGKAMMGTGEASGERRAIEAAEAAISNPLLDDVSMKGAKGVLINITGGMDMTLFEVDEAANRVRDEVDPDANIIFGSTFDASMEGRMRVSVVATGIDIVPMSLPRPVAPALQVVGGTRSAAPAPRQPAPAARVEPAARSAGIDYHHTLAPAPVHPAQAPQGHGPAGHVHTAHGHAVAGARKIDPMAEAAAQSAAYAEAGLTPPAYQAEPVPAVPAAERRDAFIPPQPIEAQRAPATAPERFTPPPAAEPAPPARKRQSLIGMVTGLGRRIVEGSEPPAAPRTEPEPSMAAPAQAPAAAPPTARAPQQQPSLSISPAERGKLSHEDQDMLDIPTFLRRQAN
jgi:cell division protein FtsZ